MKTVWIVNYYAGIPETMGNARHFEFAKHLIEAGYMVRVFRANSSSSTIEFDNKEYINKEYEGNGIKRMLSIFQFAWRFFFI